MPGWDRTHRRAPRPPAPPSEEPVKLIIVECATCHLPLAENAFTHEMAAMCFKATQRMIEQLQLDVERASPCKQCGGPITVTILDEHPE